jgi:hypothetical protein
MPACKGIKIIGTDEEYFPAIIKMFIFAFGDSCAYKAFDIEN